MVNQYFACNWQQPFLKQRKKEKDHRNNFMIKLHDSMGLGCDRTPDSKFCSRTRSPLCYGTRCTMCCNSLLLLFQEIYGRSWTKIAELIPTRTTLQIKSFANQFLKNKVGCPSKHLNVALPAKRHSNGVSLVGRLWPETVCWLGSCLSFIWLYIQWNLSKTATLKKIKNWFSIPIIT